MRRDRILKLLSAITVTLGVLLVFLYATGNTWASFDSDCRQLGGIPRKLGSERVCLLDGGQVLR